MYSEQIINPKQKENVDLRNLPYQVQASLITEEVRMALFLSPGRLLSITKSDMPRIQNKQLLIDVPIDYGKAEDYLKLGFSVNDQYHFDVNLKNLLEVLLPSVNQVISFE